MESMAFLERKKKRSYRVLSVLPGATDFGCVLPRTKKPRARSKKPRVTKKNRALLKKTRKTGKNRKKQETGFIRAYSPFYFFGGGSLRPTDP